MKIGLFTDIHANLPALEAALQFFEAQGCQRLIHLGDMIGIGPHPLEVVRRCQALPSLDCVMGNHDYWYAHGLPQPKPPWMSDEEVAHQQWTHAQLGNSYKDYFRQWPWKFSMTLAGGQKISCLHYALNEKQQWFLPVVKNPRASDLDRLFQPDDEDYMLFGHQHRATKVTGKCVYVNPGSAGCHDQASVRLCIIDEMAHVLLTNYELPYDDDGLLEAFDERKIPARDFIRKNFITR